MKTLLESLLVVTPLIAACGSVPQSSGTASVSPKGPSLVCRERNAVDTGYLVHFASSGQTYGSAELYTVTIAGERPMAAMETPVLLQPPRIPDRPQDVLMFSDPNSGYSVSLTTGDFAGIRHSHVRQKTDAGTVELADLPCQSETH